MNNTIKEKFMRLELGTLFSDVAKIILDVLRRSDMYNDLRVLL